MTSSSTSNVNNREADLNFRLLRQRLFLNSRIRFLSVVTSVVCFWSWSRTAVNFCVKSWSRSEVSTATSVFWNSPPRHSHLTTWYIMHHSPIHILHHRSLIWLISHIFQVLHHRSLTSGLTSHVMHIRHYSHNAPPTSRRTFHITCRVTGHSTFHILRGAVFGDLESAFFFFWGGGEAFVGVMATPVACFAHGHRTIYKHDLRKLDISFHKFVRTVVGRHEDAPSHDIVHEWNARVLECTEQARVKLWSRWCWEQHWQLATYRKRAKRWDDTLTNFSSE